MARVLDGKFFADEIRKEVAREVEELKKRAITPGLAVVIVGENSASQLYVKKKYEACSQVGIYSEVIRLPENTSEEELLAKVEQLNADHKINGILVQLPIPKHIDENCCYDYTQKYNNQGTITEIPDYKKALDNDLNLVNVITKNKLLFL